MIYDADEFVFQPAPAVGLARRVLIKPCANQPLPHPATTSRETLAAIIEGIRRVGDADIYVIESGDLGTDVKQIYRQLGYDFPRVTMLDVRDCPWVEVENPLPKPYALQSVWIPNILLSCDYLITVAPARVTPAGGLLTLHNLLGLLPPSKYHAELGMGRLSLQRLDPAAIVADLYFTIPFDLGVVDGRALLTADDTGDPPRVHQLGKVYVGDPLAVDAAVARDIGVDLPYLDLINNARQTMLAEV